MATVRPCHRPGFPRERVPDAARREDERSPESPRPVKGAGSNELAERTVQAGEDPRPIGPESATPP